MDLHRSALALTLLAGAVVLVGNAFSVVTGGEGVVPALVSISVR